MSLWTLHFYSDTEICLGCTKQLVVKRISHSTVVESHVSPVISMLVWTTDNVNRFVEVTISRQGVPSWRFVFCISKENDRTVISLAPRYISRSYTTSLCASPLGTIHIEIHDGGELSGSYHCSYGMVDEGITVSTVVVGIAGGIKSML